MLYLLFVREKSVLLKEDINMWIKHELFELGVTCFEVMCVCIYNISLSVSVKVYV